MAKEKQQKHETETATEAGPETVEQSAPPVAPTRTAERRAAAAQPTEGEADGQPVAGNAARTPSAAHRLGDVAGMASSTWGLLKARRTVVGAVAASVAGSAGLAYWSGRRSAARGAGPHGR